MRRRLPHEAFRIAPVETNVHPQSSISCSPSAAASMLSLYLNQTTQPLLMVLAAATTKLLSSVGECMSERPRLPNYTVVPPSRRRRIAVRCSVRVVGIVCMTFFVCSNCTSNTITGGEGLLGGLNLGIGSFGRGAARIDAGAGIGRRSRAFASSVD